MCVPVPRDLSSSAPREVLLGGRMCEDVPCSLTCDEGELSQPWCPSPKGSRGQTIAKHQAAFGRDRLEGSMVTWVDLKNTVFLLKKNLVGDDKVFIKGHFLLEVHTEVFRGKMM